MFTSKINLIRNRSSIDLNFNNVSLLLASSQDILLGVANHTNDLTIFFDLRQIFFNFFLANIILPFDTSFSKGLLLGLGPLFGKKKL